MHENTGDNPNLETLQALLVTLADHSEQLKSALIARQPEAIMAAVEEQEALMSRLQQMDLETDRDESRRSALGALAARVRGLQQTNRKLAAAFLETIERTFSFLQQSGNPGARAYDARGAVRRAGAPILVCRQG